jgi:hypothetical protein
MIACNLFEVNLSVSGEENPIVDYLFYTDLPAGTQVILSCQRTYLDLRGSLSLWVGYNERLTVVPSVQDGYCGCRGRIDVVASDKKASDLFKQINSNSPPGISTPVSEMFTIVLTVGGRQRLKEFGRNNSELSGNLVSDRGGIKVVEVSREIRIPMKSAFQPTISPS